MRTTVDLPPAAHRRARQIAEQDGRSLSAVVADLVMRGLAQVDTAAEVTLDSDSGMPVLSLGRTVTARDVAAALEDE